MVLRQVESRQHPVKVLLWLSYQTRRFAELKTYNPELDSTKDHRHEPEQKWHAITTCVCATAYCISNSNRRVGARSCVTTATISRQTGAYQEEFSPTRTSLHLPGRSLRPVARES